MTDVKRSAKQLAKPFGRMLKHWLRTSWSKWAQTRHRLRIFDRPTLVGEVLRQQTTYEQATIRLANPKIPRQALDSPTRLVLERQRWPWGPWEVVFIGWLDLRVAVWADSGRHATGAWGDWVDKGFSASWPDRVLDIVCNRFLPPDHLVPSPITWLPEK